MKIISLDCESNGLGGLAFAAAAVLTDPTGGEVETWTVRCPISGPVDPWVAANVLPALGDLGETHHAYDDMLDAWWTWYAGRREGAVVVTHVPWPVEARFLLGAHHGDLFAGPYPLLDVAPLLLAAGHDPTSVDGYLDAVGLPKPPGSPHHPLYDARAAERAFRHLIAGVREGTR